ncbi:hypothetical protein [Kitasatospora sp. NPDC089509]|uniref:hypothetical protein n=1 Tax=Kitasatospora sp. NPDC089509 TaxID=3364079 RepID=UPI003807C7C1
MPRSFGTASPWPPPGETVVAVEGGTIWDAVATGQKLGLEALSILEGETARRPGPVIWDARRKPRIYFLVPPGSTIAVEPFGCRLLSLGDYVAVPGALAIQPLGPHWLVPPDPADPERLVDPLLLASAIERAANARWATVFYAGSHHLQVLAGAKQLDGRACLRCNTTEPPLHPVGSGAAQDDAGVARPFDPVFCTSHLEPELMPKEASE